MSWRDRLAGWIAGPKAPEEASVPQVKNDTPLPQITRNSSSWGDFVEMLGKLPAPTEQTALTVSAIYACVNLIAGAIATLPVHIYRQDIKSGERDRLFTDPLNWVLNEEMTKRWQSAVGWEFLVKSLLLQGDAYAAILRNVYGEPIGLEPVHPVRVTGMIYPDGSRLAYLVMPEIIAGREIGPRRVLDQDDMLHVPGFGFDGINGMSVLRHALRMTGSKAIAMQDFAANFFANSARPDYALRTDQLLSQDVIENMRKQIDERHQGTANAFRPMLLHGGLDFKEMSMSMEDMQLVELQQFQIEEIARIYGVPPFMIGHNEKTTSWGSGVESMGIGFVRYTLRQHLNKFQAEINRKLFRTAARVAEFDTTDLERADTKSLYESLRIAVGRAGEPKLMSVNEARAVLRLKRADGMDDLGTNEPDQAKDQNDAEEQAA